MTWSTAILSWLVCKQFLILFIKIKQKKFYFGFVYVKLKNTGFVASTVNPFWELLPCAESEFEALQKVFVLLWK